MLSVIIPVYNRVENLKVCIAALEHQKDVEKDFEIIVVDDGSTDDVHDFIEDKNWNHSGSINFIGYYSGGPNKGFRGGRARNIGAFNCRGDRFVFVDSDVALNEYAIHHYEAASKAAPNAVIVGRYFYLPRYSFGHLQEILWESTSYEELNKKAIEYRVGVDYPDGALQYGIDLGNRPERDFTDDPTVVSKKHGLGALSGNISYPKSLFMQLGGFEEMMVGHGGEDADLGLNADQHEADWLFYRPIVGFHMWHTRDQERNHREVQANIAYIDAKYGIGLYANAPKYSESRDFTDPIHYHKHVGAIAIRLPDEPTVFAARNDLMTKLGISSPDWFQRLGYTNTDIKLVDKAHMDKYKEVGSTADRDPK